MRNAEHEELGPKNRAVETTPDSSKIGRPKGAQASDETTPTIKNGKTRQADPDEATQAASADRIRVPLVQRLRAVCPATFVAPEAGSSSSKTASTG